MRDIPATLAAAIEGGAATLCTAWILTRADGLRLGFTDHDASFSVQGVACEAASGWTAGAADSALGFSPGSASAAGALDAGSLDSAALTADDIAAGLYDGAKIDAWRVDWSDPASRLRLWGGTIRRLTSRGRGFTAEIDGPLAVLERVAGRSYDRLCDAQLGDARCRVDLSAHPGAVCDKRWATCTGAFANTLNFQGFPDIPGDDFIAVYAGASGPNDGGSRRG